MIAGPVALKINPANDAVPVGVVTLMFPEAPCPTVAMIAV